MVSVIKHGGAYKYFYMGADGLLINSFVIGKRECGLSFSALYRPKDDTSVPQYPAYLHFKESDRHAKIPSRKAATAGRVTNA